MARVTYVKAARQRYEMVPVLDADGNPVRLPVLKKDGTPKTDRRGKPITRRHTVVNLAKPLPNLKCGKCGEEIKVGDPYKWVKPKSGPYGGSKRYRCQTCPVWRPSELTSSSALAEVYAAQETAEDAVAEWDREDADALRAILEDLAEGIRSGAQVYEESADNMESGFGHETTQSEELREKAEMLNGSADEIEAKAEEIEDFDLDTVRDEVMADEGIEAEDYDWDEDPDGLTDEVENRRSEWADQAQSIVDDAIAEVEVP